MLVDADLWLCALDLAAVRGWKPRGTEPASGAKGDSHDRFAYFLPSGRRVLDDDALELATYLHEALNTVSDTELPLQGRRFGDENTLDLLTRAAEGAPLETEAAQGALELLSGPPKSEAFALLEFLKGGAFTIHPAGKGSRGSNHGRA